jgi:hypothetical protein
MLKDLSPESLALKELILKEYGDDDPVFNAILDAGLRALDLYHEAQSRVDEEGLTIRGDRGGLKAHPLLDTIKSARSQFFAAMKQLKIDLPDDELRGPGRPPGISY